MTEDVVMLKCDVTPVMFEDGIIRNVFGSLRRRLEESAGLQ